MDVDIDYSSDRRQEVKEYIERRYNHNGKQRVFSAGTMTTLKLKAVLKDVARVHRVPVNIVNYITAIFDDDKMTWTDLFKLAATNKKIHDFIQKYPQVIEDIRGIMGQPRSSSVHASALLVTPDQKDGEEMECFDFTPIKKVDGMLVSEVDGYALDEQGLLKNDCLGIKELSKIKAIIDICNDKYNANLTFQDIAQSGLDDPKVYQLLKEGHTQNVFQFSSVGMTKFLMSMKPNKIEDLIAANALYRPATLDSGSADRYVTCKLGDAAPVYLWGTYNAMKDTYGVLCFQEQLAQIAREVGGFSLGEGVKLVKLISKKKIDKIKALRGKFMDGANAKGCPKDDAEAIWDMFEAAGSYLFNSSHATAYAITAYVGAFLKANYPSAFYTIALQWADDKEIPSLMSEMEQCSKAKIVHPDINVSDVQFFTDYQNDEIFWSLTRIKMVGVKTVEYIVEERQKNGAFTSIENFIHRIFKYKLKKYEYWDDSDNEEEARKVPVNARHVKHLILAGCFDKIENVKSLPERYRILCVAAKELGFDLKEEDFPSDMTDKHYFWSMLQIEVSGIGSVDYRRIYDNSEAKQHIRGRASYMTIKDAFLKESEGKRIAVCATVLEHDEVEYQDKKTGEKKTFCKLKLQQNNDIIELVMWDDFYKANRDKVIQSKNKMIIVSAIIKYSDYSGCHCLQTYKSSMLFNV
ncbi:DNA polymerase III subunit alpha [Parabacteroides merdae]|nr:DNA polymerase III subunit alpha [Parabacteroides merdae]MBT9638189.1 DNA polymerase III subunit alpha [Parabacteroides merdae]